jgi:hypothetical protein
LRAAEGSRSAGLADIIHFYHEPAEARRESPKELG